MLSSRPRCADHATNFRGGDRGLHLHRLIVATVRPAAILIADRHGDGNHSVERRRDVIGVSAIGLFRRRHCIVDAAVPHDDGTKLTVDDAHHRLHAALVRFPEIASRPDQQLNTALPVCTPGALHLPQSIRRIDWLSIGRQVTELFAVSPNPLQAWEQQAIQCGLPGRVPTRRKSARPRPRVHFLAWPVPARPALSYVAVRAILLAITHLPAVKPITESGNVVPRIGGEGRRSPGTPSERKVPTTFFGTRCDLHQPWHMVGRSVTGIRSSREAVAQTSAIALLAEIRQLAARDLVGLDPTGRAGNPDSKGHYTFVVPPSTVPGRTPPTATGRCRYSGMRGGRHDGAQRGLIGGSGQRCRGAVNASAPERHAAT